MGIIQPVDVDKELYADFCALLSKHTGTQSKEVILAIACNIVGKLIALQDQRKYTPEQIMKLVSQNIEMGNQQAVELLASQTAGNA